MAHLQMIGVVLSCIWGLVNGSKTRKSKVEENNMVLGKLKIKERILCLS